MKKRPIIEDDHFVSGLFVKEFSPKKGAASAAPILMIHGSCHGWWAFEKWLPFFAEAGWESYALSLRNHMDSYTVPYQQHLQLGVRDYIDDVVRVLDWLRKPAILIGHSMGGIIAQKVAEEHGAKALVLVATVGPARLGPIREALPEDKPIWIEAEEVKRQWVHRMGEETFDALCSRLVPESPGVVNEYSLAKGEVEPEVIECPVIVIGPENDNTVVHDARLVADFYHAECYIIPDCGHDVMLEEASLQAANVISNRLLSVLDTE